MGLIVSIAALVAAAVFIIAFYTFSICFRTPVNHPNDPYVPLKGKQYAAVADNIHSCISIMDKTPCRWVYVNSFDDLQLAGRYYHTADGAPLVILMHGYRSLALRDCCGGFMLCKKMGFNVLAVDQRAHGCSEGSVISFGIQERYDCQRWVDFAVAEFGPDTKIVLSGLSMGAATVLMASSLSLPENVVAIMADSPYNTASGIIRKVCRDGNLPDGLAYPFIKLGAKVFGHFNLEETSAMESVKHAKVPILLIHGEDDRFVPCDMSRELYEACGDMAQLHTFPEAGHGLAYMIDPVRYEIVTVDFLWDIPELTDHMQTNAYAQKIRQRQLDF